MIIIQKIKSLIPTNYRTYKNFGHKRQPIPLVTTIWHGFLTFTFIGLTIEWKNTVYQQKSSEELVIEVQRCSVFKTYLSALTSSAGRIKTFIFGDDEKSLESSLDTITEVKS